jgi:hypothetical protein
MTPLRQLLRGEKVHGALFVGRLTCQVGRHEPHREGEGPHPGCEHCACLSAADGDGVEFLGGHDKPPFRGVQLIRRGQV